MEFEPLCLFFPQRPKERGGSIAEDALSHDSTTIHSGWMDKRGKIVTNWKERFFVLLRDGKMLYFTDDTMQIRKGIADFSNVTGFNRIDNKSFEVMTPDRVWCFRCKFKSECDYWIQMIKSIDSYNVHSNVPDRDFLNLSSNKSVRALIAEMGPPEGERVLYSDRILISDRNSITDNNVNNDSMESTVLMLTTAAIYNLAPNQNNYFKKCDRRIPWRLIACCNAMSVREVCIEDVVYQTETENLRLILHTLREMDVEVLFQRDEDEGAMSLPLEQENERDLVHVDDVLKMKSISYLETPTAKEYNHHYYQSRHRSTYTESGEEKEPETPEQPEHAVPVIPQRKSLRKRDFKFLSVIGRGTFGKILMVQRKSDDTIFAMKIMKKMQIVRQGQARNIQTEREVLKSIDHPFLMKLRHAFQTKSKLYLVLDYYRGGDLNHHIHQNRRLSFEAAKFIAAQIALAIGCLHSHGIVYRDLKPENILMDDVGNCCLCDFGLCKKLSDTPRHQKTKNKNKGYGVKSTQTPCGTPDYVAPEVVKRLSYDQNVDWWSFGILVFEMTVGSVPFFSLSLKDTYQRIKSSPVPYPSWMKKDDPECKQFIGALLERNVEKRLGFKNDIDDIKAHSWFENTNWNHILQKKVDPPYRPNVDLSEEMETVPQNVAPHYLKEKVNERQSVSALKVQDVDIIFDEFTFDGCSSRSSRPKLTDDGSISIKLSKDYPIKSSFNEVSHFEVSFDAETMDTLEELSDEHGDGIVNLY